MGTTILQMGRLRSAVWSPSSSSSNVFRAGLFLAHLPLGVAWEEQYTGGTGATRVSRILDEVGPHEKVYNQIEPFLAAVLAGITVLIVLGFFVHHICSGGVRPLEEGDEDYDKLAEAIEQGEGVYTGANRSRADTGDLSPSITDDMEYLRSYLETSAMNGGAPIKEEGKVKKDANPKQLKKQPLVSASPSFEDVQAKGMVQAGDNRRSYFQKIMGSESWSLAVGGKSRRGSANSGWRDLTGGRRDEEEDGGSDTDASAISSVVNPLHYHAGSYKSSFPRPSSINRGEVTAGYTGGHQSRLVDGIVGGGSSRRFSAIGNSESWASGVEIGGKGGEEQPSDSEGSDLGVTLNPMLAVERQDKDSRGRRRSEDKIKEGSSTEKSEEVRMRPHLLANNTTTSSTTNPSAIRPSLAAAGLVTNSHRRLSLRRQLSNATPRTDSSEHATTFKVPADERDHTSSRRQENAVGGARGRGGVHQLFDGGNRTAEAADQRS